MLDAVGYFDILVLMKNSRFIVTDSGGIQEEATSSKIRKKVLVTRTSVDRPESVQAGFSEIIGIRSEIIRKKIFQTASTQFHPRSVSPYGNGTTAKNILKITDKFF
jgi:UDP-N-acetylglucosamine 2-epimerase (non-hydrolysing)